MTEHLLVTIGKERFHNPERHSVHFVDDNIQNDFLNDIENTPQAYVLGCLMDRQIKAERAWSIPYRIKNIIGNFDIDDLVSITLDEYKDIFNRNNLHWLNDTMAGVFHSAVNDIKIKFKGDVSCIWCNIPSSAKVVYEFLQFKGSGKKIATMAANILARQFKVPFSDYYSIDISPDVHILRVMMRTRLVDANADLDSVIYKARELNPEFPGIIDFSCWEIGRTWCRPSHPSCELCIIHSQCKMVL